MTEDYIASLPVKEFSELVTSLRGRRVAVLGHARPDGDCIGSQVALTRILRQQEVDAFAVNGDPVPRVLQELVADTPFHGADGIPEEDVITAITVDCADANRMGKQLASRFPEILLNIDHHVSNAQYAQENFVFAESSATAEILAQLFFAAGYPVDATTASALYAGIATDTGQFRYQSTSPMVFSLCARLCEHGAVPFAIAKDIYERESPAKLALLQRYLQSFRYHCGGRACVGILTQRDWQETKATSEDTEGLVDYARSIDGVAIGVLVEERPDGTLKGSFRAKDPVHRVDQLAALFHGGGHACAAGFTPQESTTKEFLPRLEEALQSHFQQLEQNQPA